MVRFGCLVCEKKFKYVQQTDVNGNEISGDIPVLTVCGHYFHLECLKASFLYERERVKYNRDVPLSPGETSIVYTKFCPLASCKHVLNKTKVTKIRIKDDDPEDTDEIISKQQEQIKQLQERLERSNKFQIGDSVSFHSAKTGEEVYGSVSGILVEIHVHNRMPKRIESCSDRGGDRTCKPKRNSSRVSLGGSETVSVDLVHPASPSMLRKPKEQEKTDKKKMERSKKEMEKYSNDFEKMQPKWAAGDRIYMTKEKEFATIKWIGNRQYKFMVAIEYDRAVGDDQFVSDDLPFLIQPGFGKQLSFEELNATAEKVNPNSPRALLNTIVRWGTIRNRRPQNPMFFVERSHSSS